MNSGRLFTIKVISCGFGLPLNEKHAVLLGWHLVIARVKLVRHCGKAYLLIIENEPCVIRIYGMLMELCYQVNDIMPLGARTARKVLFCEQEKRGVKQRM